MALVNLLMDHSVLRRKSAFNLLSDDNFAKVNLRLQVITMNVCMEFK